MEFDKSFKTVKDSIKISLESPMGLAIKGKKSGETVKMRLNNEKKEIRILDVK
jgi:transcription elongation GreA/GreB family factor